MLTFEELTHSLPDLAVREKALLKQAYDFAKQAHKGQKRASGEDHFVHCLEVARLLTDLKLDPSVIAAGLLHDVVEDTPVSTEEIQERFGEEVARLVAGVTKMEHVSLDTERVGKGKPRDREAEYLRKTLLAMNDDVRVILIKLADRLHNMRTLGHLSHERQQRMARETLEIFAPLANRLGIWQVKWELEDLCFRYLNPDRYKEIASLIDERRADRDFYVEKVIKELKAKLGDNGISAEISGRSKHIYSIWRKMERRQISFNQVFDVRAIRIIVQDTATCYQVLGIVHQMWRPVPGEFDDYVAAPKDNFYQSLHTAVYLEDGKTLEVQIRSLDMHRSAEYGVAAHWRYKESMGSKRDEPFERRIQYLRDLMEVGRNVADPTEFLDTMRSDVFQDRVYVFTPKGDIVDLPAGATPIDLAYHIHTDVGDRCRGAKVNGKLVALDTPLQVGDRVEILTAKRGGPSRDWMNTNLGYVKTKRAVTKIRQWFRKQDREKMISAGRDALDRELKRLGLEKMSHEQIAELFDVDKPDELLAQIGFGDINPQHIATRLLDIERQESPEPDTLTSSPPITKRATGTGISIQGTGGLLTTLARCCNPVQGDAIIGYITRGRGVSIHRRDCRNVLNTHELERLIDVEWGATEDGHYLVPVVINAYDREGLMRDIGAAVADEHINMQDVQISTHNHIATFSVTMRVESIAQLSRILSRVERLPNVIEARRVTN
jgi:GTP diphosphokinase / guanosine-3',5'-bis(diphosphate) 3'-diphosphatase